MPIEELLKMYSCAATDSYPAPYHRPARDDQYGSAGTSGSEEEILNSGDLTLDKREISAELLGKMAKSVIDSSFYLNDS